MFSYTDGNSQITYFNEVVNLTMDQISTKFIVELFD